MTWSGYKVCNSKSSGKLNCTNVFDDFPNLFILFYYQEQYYKINNLRRKVILMVSYFLQVKVFKMNPQAKDGHFSE
jgi:hypothetical protein